MDYRAVRSGTFLHPGQKRSRRPSALGPSGVRLRLRLRLGAAPEPTTLDHAGGVKRSAAEMTTATLTADWVAYAEVCTRFALALLPLCTRSAPSALPLLRLR